MFNLENYINRISKSIVLFLDRKNTWGIEKRKSIDKIIRMSIYNVVITSVLFTISLLLNILTQMIIVSIIFWLLRLFAGGFHTNINNCFIISVPMAILSFIMAKYTNNYCIFIFGICIFYSLYTYKYVVRDLDKEFMGKISELKLNIDIRNIFKQCYIFCLIVLTFSNSMFIMNERDIIANSINIAMIMVSFTISNSGDKFFKYIDKKLLTNGKI